MMLATTPCAWYDACGDPSADDLARFELGVRVQLTLIMRAARSL